MQRVQGWLLPFTLAWQRGQVATAVDVLGLRKAYGGLVALDGVNLSVTAGTVHGLLGPNGAGKTTLLRVLLGLVRADAGTVQLLGRDASSGSNRLEAIAGFVDAPRMWPYLTGRRTLELLAALDDGDGARRIDEVLDLVGLTDRADSKVRGWSTGMRQRLGLAGALLRDPQLLILDEPTSGLDPAGIADVHALLLRLASQGVTVLVSSHNFAEVQAVCTEVTVLAQGTVRFSGPLDQLPVTTAPASHRLRTSDDAAAIAALADHPDVALAEASLFGLMVRADQRSLDAFLIAIAAAGIAVRSLRQDNDPLAQAFLELTA